MTQYRWPLPDAMAQRFRQFRAEGGTPAVPRRAATVVLVRPATDGLQVYVIRRAVSMVFGGVYAFPGGGVDPVDADDALPGWGPRLALPDGEAAAVVRAAVREVFEEAGVLLAGPDLEANPNPGLGPRPRQGQGPGQGSAAGPGRTRGREAGRGPEAGSVLGDVSGADWEADRQALAGRGLSLTDLLARRGLRVRDDLLAPWSRWVTPEFEPRRFDTYFFVAVLPAGQRTRDVSGEADRTLWIRPSEAVAGHASGELAMLPPTVATLQEMAGYADLDELFAAAADRDAARPVLPRIEIGPDGAARLTA